MFSRFFKLLLLILSISLFCQDCSRNKIRIGYLLDDFSSDRWYRDRDLFIQRSSELGATVMVDSAMGDYKRQYEQAKFMLDKGIDVLVIVATNSIQAAGIVKLAHQYNVLVISYDRLIQNCDLDYYISFENTNVGELMANYLSKRCPVGNYAIICGPPSDYNSFFIKFGQMSVLQPLIEKGDIKIVYDSCVAEWNPDLGYKHMKNCLAVNNKIDAVLCANDMLAQGAIKALKEVGLAGEVLVSGQDAEADAIRSIIAGNQTMTVYKPIEAIAFVAASTAIKLANQEPVVEANQYINNGVKMIPSILLQSMVVNRDNINMTVMTEDYFREHDIAR